MNAPLNVVAEHVTAEDVSFLDACRFRRGNLKCFMGHGHNRSTVLARKSYGKCPKASCGFQRGANIPAIA